MSAKRRVPAPRSTANPAPTPSPEELAALRAGIDRLDRSLIRTLSQRARLVVKVGAFKRATGVPIYAPHREQEVLAKVLALNPGPLQGRTIEAIYRELMSGSFALEHPLKIGFLGPAGSFSHVAAVRQFGSSVAFEDLREIAGVFTEVQRGHVDYGLVPIENSAIGGITETLDAFIASGHQHSERTGDGNAKVNVYAEVLLGVHHALMANSAPSSIRRIYSKPEVFGQCRTWLATQFPKAELVPVASSSRGVQMVAEEKPGRRGASAAIGNSFAGELYGVNILFPRIEDDPNNLTRFYVISRQRAQRSGDDKTSMMFATLNKPGALVSVLNVFHRAGVNLTHIDKRPSRRTNWQYTFFIDAQGHESDPAIVRAISGARRHCQELVVLGSFPRARRVL
ncbi:MAG: bifunctional chorismate mutase/prephenate dehydratase [Phycisphaerales bacterium]